MRIWVIREILIFVIGIFLAGFALGWWVYS